MKKVHHAVSLFSQFDKGKPIFELMKQWAMIWDHQHFHFFFNLHCPDQLQQRFGASLSDPRHPSSSDQVLQQWTGISNSDLGIRQWSGTSRSHWLKQLSGPPAMIRLSGSDLAPPSMTLDIPLSVIWHLPHWPRSQPRVSEWEPDHCWRQITVRTDHC